MSETHDRFSRAVEIGVRLDNDWRGLERRIRDTVPDLAAASYGSEPGDPLVWCDRHERPVADCHRHDELCNGTPLEHKTDPTGDAAVGNHAWEDAGKFTAWAKKASHALEQMALIAQRYKPDDPRQSAEVEQANDKGACEVCARSEKHTPAAGRTDYLGRMVPMCTFHAGFLRRHGRMTTPEEEATHQRGKRVTARVSQMDRLRGGLLSGKL